MLAWLHTDKSHPKPNRETVSRNIMNGPVVRKLCITYVDL